MAKLKREELRIIFNGKTAETQFGFFGAPHIENSVNFFDAQTAESDEWLLVNDAKELVDEHLEIPDKTGAYAALGKRDLTDIRVIIKYSDEGIIWQKITPSKILTNERALFIETDRPVVNERDKSVSVSGRVDAFYDRGTQKLYFKKMSTVNAIFPNLSQYYRLATDEEREEFLGSGFVIAKNVSNFSERTMKLIAAVLDDEMIDLSDAEDKQNVLQIAQQYAESAGINVNYNEETHMFVVETAKELQFLLQVLLGRYYLNPVTMHKMHANYARKV